MYAEAPRRWTRRLAGAVCDAFSVRPEILQPLRLLFILLFPFFELSLLFWLGHRLGEILLGYLFVAFVVGGLLLRRSRALTPPWTAGILMMIPGVLTDLLALLILIPASRRCILGWLLRGVRVEQVGRPGFPFGPPSRGPEAESHEQSSAPIQDAEFRILPDKAPPDEGAL